MKERMEGQGEGIAREEGKMERWKGRGRRDTMKWGKHRRRIMGGGIKGRAWEGVQVGPSLCPSAVRAYPCSYLLNKLYNKY